MTCTQPPPVFFPYLLFTPPSSTDGFFVIDGPSSLRSNFRTAFAADNDTQSVDTNTGSLLLRHLDFGAVYRPRFAV